MAPEQFSGNEADARSDIWAFGAALYEMVTGRKAFAGASYQSLVGAILAADPAPMAVKPFTPSWLERLVRRCLAKEPEERYHCMRDLVLDLRTPPVEAVAPKASRWPWAAAAAMLVLGVLGTWAVMRSRQAPAPEQVLRSQLLPPEGAQFDLTNGFALSPDGRSLAFVASAPGKSGIWVRPMDGTTARLLPGTERPIYPFWSPDSRSLAYQASGKLWRVDVGGGSPIAVCDAGSSAGGDWAADGTIVFAMSTLGLRRVSASGGTPEVLTTPDANRGETGHRWPQLLPGGRILFLVSGKPEQSGIYAASLANPRDRVRLVAASGQGVYAAGHLLWLRGSTLVAQRFDPERLELSGEPRPVADPVGSGALGRMLVAASASISGGGLLVHGRAGGLQLGWVDRAGKAAPPGGGELGRPGDYLNFRVSPDGRRVAVSRTSDGGYDLWMVDGERDAWSRFTFLPGSEASPAWSPDGRQVMFNAGSPGNLYRKEASGAGTEKRVTESANQQFPADWSRDGRLVLYGESAPETQRDLWVLPVTPEGKPESGASANAGPRPYLRTNFNEWGGRLSPDLRPGLGPRWVAYTSDESGRFEVYVQAFPEPRDKFQISTGGGSFPEWSPDGRELYFVSAEGKLMAAELKVGVDSVVPSTPRELFAVAAGGLYQPYAVAPDGKRFLVKAPVGGSQPLEVVVNWTALLKKAVAVE